MIEPNWLPSATNRARTQGSNICKLNIFGENWQTLATRFVRFQVRQLALIPLFDTVGACRWRRGAMPRLPKRKKLE
jgi:hypothetical protein